MTPGTLVGGKYRLSRQLGAGGMGVVWSAVNITVAREVALKLILGSSEDLTHRLLREARACGSLRHRNIVEVYDVDRTAEGAPFLVMELLTGETLAELLKRQRRLDGATAAGFARDVALALVAAHAAGIVHRDLKPANIFLHEEAGADERLAKVVKVLDFGVSKNTGADAPDGLVTQTGALLGSPAYMSPEQARGKRDVDHRSDIWSLGVVLFEMLTGVRPFKGDPTQLQVAIHADPIPLVSRFVRTVDAALVKIVSRCLERDIALRVQTAAELAELLRPHADGTATRTPVAAPDPLRQSLVDRDSAPASTVATVVPAPDADETAATTRLDPRALAQLFPRGAEATAPAAAAPTSARPPVKAPTFGPPPDAPPPSASLPQTVDATAPLSSAPRTTVRMTQDEALGVHVATFSGAAARASSADAGPSSGAGAPAIPLADAPGATSTAGQLVAPRPSQPSAVDEETIPLGPSPRRRTLALAAAAGTLALAITVLTLALWRSRSSHVAVTPAAAASAATPTAASGVDRGPPAASGEPAPVDSASAAEPPPSATAEGPRTQTGSSQRPGGQRDVVNPWSGASKAPPTKAPGRAKPAPLQPKGL
jgi:serine/threonine protein kinase